MQEFEFKGSQGYKLSARLDEAVGEVKAYALFAHCFTCGKDMPTAGRIARILTKENISVVRFDFTGLGKSEGNFANTNFTSNVEDLVKAADYMRQNFQAPSVLIGHSLGGAAVLVAAQQIAEAKAIATIGAPADAAHVAHLFHEDRLEIMKKGEAEVCLAGRPFKIKKQFIDDIENQNMVEAISKLDKALMIMHGPFDQTVGIENAGRIFSAAKHPKSYISLDDADHLLTRKEDAQYAGRVIAEWAGRYLT
jgi:putative redox protein